MYVCMCVYCGSIYLAKERISDLEDTSRLSPRIWNGKYGRELIDI